MTDVAQRTEAPTRTLPPETNGLPPRPGEAPPAGTPAPPKASRRLGGVQRLILVVLALAAIIGGSIVGYRWWYDSTTFVTTDNAQVAGRLSQVGGLAAGRVAAIRYDIGDRVAADAVVAALSVPVAVGTTSNGVPRLEYRETSDSMIEVKAPVAGVVVARSANPGDTVPAGQPLLTLVDPRQLWVTANIEETQVRRVQVGQPVSVHIDTLNLDLEGRVVAVTPASAGTFSLLPSQNTSGNFTKVTQLVPVRVMLDAPDPRLVIGTSASVKIRVQN